MEKKQRYLTLAIWTGALAVIAAALLMLESDQLWKIEQKNLFLCSALYLREQLVVPGGLLTWLGTWFTQMLHYPWLGVGLLCGWWLLLMAVTRRAFRISDRWAVLMLTPVALLLATNVDMGYWIYLLKLRGHFFVSTIGVTAVAALLWAFRALPDRPWLRPAAIAVTAAAGYPLMGIYGLGAALLMGLWSWRLSASRTQAVVCSAVALVSVAAVPLLCYHYVYYQTNLANIYWAELPLFYLTEEYHAYYIPYYLLALFYAVLTLTCPAGPRQKPMSRPLYLLCQAVVSTVLIAGVWHAWMKDENFHRELRMQHRIAQLDWTGVLQEAADQQDEPTRAIVMMRNLALTRIGRQGDDMFRYKNGSKAYAAPFGMRLMMVAGQMIYYQYGMLNYCNRLCIEMGVEFGFRLEDYLLLTDCALLDGDEPLARKYIGLLRQTLFYSDWAERAEALLGRRDLQEKDPERGPITHMLHHRNVLTSDNGYTERFLMTQLATSQHSDDPMFQEQCLLATLWTKDVKQFWYHFENYVRQHPKAPIPRYYQEAAYLYSRMADLEYPAMLPLDPGVKDTYERFNGSAAAYDGQDVADVRQALYPFYGETYYFDYFTMSQLPEY